MPMPLRERRRLMLRDEILNAAQALMVEKGFAAMSMDELAAEVGISKPTLYSHFTGKDDLVAAVATRAMEQLIAVAEEDPHNRTPLDRLVLLLRHSIQMHAVKGKVIVRPWTPELFRLICGNERAATMLAHLDALVVDLVDQAIAQGEIDRQFDPASVVRAFYALVGSLHFAHYSASGTPDPERAPDTLAEIFRRGVAPRTDDQP